MTAKEGDPQYTQYTQYSMKGRKFLFFRHDTDISRFRHLPTGETRQKDHFPVSRYYTRETIPGPGSSVGRATD